MTVRAKKHLGQHFLKDDNICRKIASSLSHHGQYNKVVEIGPGMGALTKHLITIDSIELVVVDIDTESIAYLEKEYPDLSIISGDFLKLNFESTFGTNVSVIGNFPYNISSQILFKVLDNRNHVPEVVGMFQKEMAERVAVAHGSKTYGILSVLVQAFYDVEYLFTVSENVFIPPPKVKSAVIRLKRNDVSDLGCDENLFKRVVKLGFNQRRKTLRNSLKSLMTQSPNAELEEMLTKRPEQLSVAQFIKLTKLVEAH